jgi:peptide chain release factor 1
VAREQASLAATVAAYREYQRVLREAADAAELAREEIDPELREMAVAEEQRLRDEADTLRGRLVELLTPKDPMADRNIIMEIRGTGGEAVLAGDLFRCTRTSPSAIAGSRGLKQCDRAGAGSRSSRHQGAARTSI